MKNTSLNIETVDDIITNGRHIESVGDLKMVMDIVNKLIATGDYRSLSRLVDLSNFERFTGLLILYLIRTTRNYRYKIDNWYKFKLYATYYFYNLAEDEYGEPYDRRRLSQMFNGVLIL